jgi:hypothetical protein
MAAVKRVLNKTTADTAAPGPCTSEQRLSCSGPLMSTLRISPVEVVSPERNLGRLARGWVTPSISGPSRSPLGG